MNPAIHLYYGGMSGTADTAVQIGTGVAEKIVPTVVGPSVAAILGISTAAAIPIVGAVIAGISLGIEAILHSGCGQTCIVTSQWANQAETYLQKNISEYFAIAPPRPKSVQKLAMGNFQAIWNTLVQQCSQPNLGTAGQNCINDRKDGACKWNATGGQYPGGPAVGQCWNWWNGYYWPIANDTNVYDDSAATAAAAISSVVSSVTGGTGIDTNLLLVLAGAGLLLLVALS